MPPHLPIAIIGAGPIGLAAAAHILARGETPIVFEAGEAVGQSIRAWAHVRVFSPWGFNVDQAAAALLAAAGWKHPPMETLHTGGEFIEQYLEPLAALPEMRRHLHLRTRVIRVTRKGYDKVRTAERAQQPFVVRALESDGEEHALEAKAVIDASGTWTSPNPAGADGLPAIGERMATWRPPALGDARHPEKRRRDHRHLRGVDVISRVQTNMRGDEIRSPMRTAGMVIRWPAPCATPQTRARCGGPSEGWEDSQEIAA